MKSLITTVELSTAAIVIIGILSVYMVGISAFYEYNHWPKFGDPSYSKYSGVLCLYLFACFFVALTGVLFQLIKLPILLYRKSKQKTYVLSICYLAVHLFYLLDPVGLMNWYID